MALNLTVTKASAADLTNVVAGPWTISADSSEKALMLLFILDCKYNRSPLTT